MGGASGAAPKWCKRSWSSGSCASPPMPIACWKGLTVSPTGRKRSRLCSGTGLGGRWDATSSSRWMGLGKSSRYLPPGWTPSLAPPLWPLPLSTRWRKRPRPPPPMPITGILWCASKTKPGCKGKRKGAKRRGVSPVFMPKTPSTGKNCPFGWPTSCSWTTAPAPSCRCPPTTSGILPLPASTGFPSAWWFWVRAWTRTPSFPKPTPAPGSL
ncbi:hypothetical protein HRbin09_01904 [bacterium HR09]|nr:hypothetical protein HRbin09_01904 [bacterium HR09]